MSSGSAPERSSLTIAGNKLMCPANCATVAAGYSAACQNRQSTVPGGVPPMAKRGHQLLSDCQRPVTQYVASVSTMSLDTERCCQQTH